MEVKTFKIGGVDYNFKFFVERRNSTRASVTKSGVNIRIPKHLSTEKKRSEINSLIRWAINKIEQNPPEKKREYTHEDEINIFDKIYSLNIEIRDSEKNFAKIEKNVIYFKIAQKHNPKKRQEYISKQLQKLLSKYHTQDLFERATFLNEKHFQKKVFGIKFKNTKSRWGCCNYRKKEIDFSSRLLLAPLEVLDYVIIHELAHLIEPNHSKNFWKLVCMADPAYKLKIKWLKKNGNKLVL